jgi:peptidoglycan DL-endopeptidase CwlO
LPPLGARRTPHRRWSRHAARSVLLAAILLPLTLLSNGPMTALATPATSARLEDQLDKQNRQADQLVEQYNQSNEALKKIRRSLKGLRAEANGAQADVRELQATLGARASAAYVQGAGSAVAAVLGSNDPAAAIARVQVLDLLAARDGDLMDQLGVAGKAFDERQRNLLAAEKAQAAEVQRLAAKKAEVEQAADRTRALLSRMRAADRPSAPSPASSGPVAPPPPPSGGGGGGSGSAAAAVAYARAQVGKPYCYGGAGPGCYDCSGLTMMAWRQAGVSLPHSSASQFNVGRRISASELQPGDLIFYYSPISHVSIYIGGGQRISATHTGDYVRVQSLGSSIVGYARPNG